MNRLGCSRVCFVAAALFFLFWSGGVLGQQYFGVPDQWCPEDRCYRFTNVDVHPKCSGNRCIFDSINVVEICAIQNGSTCWAPIFGFDVTCSGYCDQHPEVPCGWTYYECSHTTTP